MLISSFQIAIADAKHSEPYTIIGVGCSYPASTGAKAANRRPTKLHIPRAVAANSTGNIELCATNKIVKTDAIPYSASTINSGKYHLSWLARPWKTKAMLASVDRPKDKVTLSLSPSYLYMTPPCQYATSPKSEDRSPLV